LSVNFGLGGCLCLNAVVLWRMFDCTSNSVPQLIQDILNSSNSNLGNMVHPINPMKTWSVAKWRVYLFEIVKLGEAMEEF
jgi:hypothetical protein